MNVMKVIKKDPYRILVYSAVGTSLVLTPFWNKDSLIIPKVIILFCTALYLLPIVISELKTESQQKSLKFLKIVLLLIIIQMLLSVIASDAPLVQQVFGRTGRGLGLITFCSLTILLIASAIFIKIEYMKKLVFGLFLAGFISSLYAIFQKFGVDLLSWESRTNGIIGTLGNPNFQSSFAAMTLVPGLVYFWGKKYSYVYLILIGILFISTIIATQSTQGYVTSLASILVFILIALFYKRRVYFYVVLMLSIFSTIVAISGMLNNGPLSYYLYKISVQSRGDFWRAALNTANENPIFGVGIDSFGDSFLIYRDTIAANHPFAEYTDNSHNMLLEYAATGGYPLLILNLTLIVFTILSFVKLQKKLGKFNRFTVAVFASWTVYQLQSIISPANIGMLFWNYIISGTFIGLASEISKNIESKNNLNSKVTKPSKIMSTCLVILGLIIVYPYFNVDKMQLQAMQTGNGELAIKSATSYPESVLRYAVMGRALLDSKLPNQSLDLARSAVNFNPNAISAWVLILINPAAPIEEREKARTQILRLDPLNKEILEYKF
jgi:O-antigen ligase